jgi:hypothetical protein
MATPEVNERVVYKVLTEGHYRKHVERVRVRLDRARDETREQLERLGLRIFPGNHAGIYLWADTGVDTNVIATAGHEEAICSRRAACFRRRRCRPRGRASTWPAAAIRACSVPGRPDGPLVRPGLSGLPANAGA